MFSPQDLEQLAQRGISVDEVENQLKKIAEGFPFLRLKAAASVGMGILAPSKDETDAYINKWHEYKAEGHTIVKFVPASGAASRMFKNLFEFLDAPYNEPTTDFEKTFFAERKKFAFRKILCATCKENSGGRSVCGLIGDGDYKAVVSNLLLKEGLNYGQMPKGLLLFHNYEDGPRTPMEEHLVEAALYASSNGEVNVHFTVSHEHKELFKARVAETEQKYAERFGIKFNISFSEQKPSTDTIAANLDNTPFRNEDGSLLFRPGGHGALIENLSEIDADVVFIKNIDNVVPDRLKDDTVRYKQLLAGILIQMQEKAFEYLHILDSGVYNHDTVEEIISFVQRDLCCRRDDIKNLEDAELVIYLKKKLNRPMRVCGVVRNVGEPGGGPFIVYNQDGTTSLQILESSQIDKMNEENMRMFAEATHFNPVDIACALKNYKGERFQLQEFVDPTTGFISSKSSGGRELKAFELPGLWNGAMSDWNTIFVEVPLSTFNPVKTVNDLLRDEHQ